LEIRVFCNWIVRRRPPTSPWIRGDTKYKLASGDGLYLEVMQTGAKYWRGKYRHGGKEKRLALGVFAQVPLAQAP